jgi:hypothetical protein
MLRSWPRSAESRALLAGALVMLALALSAPADARRGGAPRAAASVTVDKRLSQKQQAELSAERAGNLARSIRACLATAPAGPVRKDLERQTAAMERDLQGAAQAYHVGNYDQAVKRYAAIEKSSRTASLACDKIRQSAERCSQQVSAAVDRIRQWSLKIARLQDPTSRAHCEMVYAQTERDLQSLGATCATTDPASVAQRIPVVLKPLDEAIRRSR